MLIIGSSRLNSVVLDNDATVYGGLIMRMIISVCIAILSLQSFAKGKHSAEIGSPSAKRGGVLYLKPIVTGKQIGRAHV